RVMRDRGDVVGTPTFVARAARQLQHRVRTHVVGIRIRPAQAAGDDLAHDRTRTDRPRAVRFLLEVIRSPVHPSPSGTGPERSQSPARRREYELREYQT